MAIEKIRAQALRYYDNLPRTWYFVQTEDLFYSYIKRKYMYAASSLIQSAASFKQIPLSAILSMHPLARSNAVKKIIKI